MASLKKFGQVKPVLVDEATKEIVAGNATFEAARRLKWTELAAIYVAGKDHAALAIADNRTAELAGWDAVTLQLLLAELHGSDEDLYDALALEELSNSLAPEAGDNGESPESSVQSPEPGAESPEPGADQPIRDQYSVVVDCRDEADQKQLYEQLTAAGRTCRVLTI
jgi:ParB-like chromosome segregation protein Spo0J